MVCLILFVGHVRHQLMATIDGVSVYVVLEKGLEDLMAMCDVVEEKFKVSRDDFVNKMQE
jgi:DNA-directed RNA polymerase I and III subunit RPAC2